MPVAPYPRRQSAPPVRAAALPLRHRSPPRPCPRAIRPRRGPAPAPSVPHRGPAPAPSVPPRPPRKRVIAVRIETVRIETVTWILEARSRIAGTVSALAPASPQQKEPWRLWRSWRLLPTSPISLRRGPAQTSHRSKDRDSKDRDSKDRDSKDRDCDLDLGSMIPHRRHGLSARPSEPPTKKSRGARGASGARGARGRLLPPAPAATSPAPQAAVSSRPRLASEFRPGRRAATDTPCAAR